MLTRLGLAATVLAAAMVATTGAVSAAPSRPRIPEVTAVAHRGASAYAPENTLAAIDEARARGARVVELDVQRTRDGVPVLIHDTTLTRTTDVEEVFPGRASYRVADFTFAEIRRLDAGSWFDPAYEGERVPTLREGLDRLRRQRLNLLLELKEPARYPGLTEEVAETLDEQRWWTGRRGQGNGHRLVIQSFDHEAVRVSHDLLPHIPHGVLGKVPVGRIPAYAEWADQINPNHTTVDAAYVDAVHAEGLEIYVYTVNDADTMRATIAKGVDGIISDRPDLLLKVIEEETGAR
ncbi:glycerophosphodiester phosphodiesterase [Actinorugispora endophytica]|uniref:Glycerophosphoryl diester phosphodiesterase n=1 Tax=Actinorugispora endophytica TaxID=1605990 RepID=A0A4R6UPY3_9ACTN|nr:glycerophosphodiester phosphodiesterase family protein [Actinorugispora endophytica]TDQ49290.1 glycerophosphoryl diester phosphodiesterase [Actinorugispora endophytica]